MRLLVVTCAHRGDDARIVHRQARSLLEAGHTVTLIAPPAAAVALDPHGLRRISVPRATGRRRVRAWAACVRAVRSQRGGYDLLLLHDPELLPLLVPWVRRPIVWDVHEDFAAAVADRAWIPGRLAPVVRRGVVTLERWASRRCHLVLAEEAYRSRFPGAPVVPNSTWVQRQPAPLDRARPARVVYLGRLSRSRGAFEMMELARRLADEVEVVLVGEADSDIREALATACAGGSLTWHGPLANPEALRHVTGAFAGLSLLHPEPNFVHSRPTKLVEYLAHGVPAITSPLPLAAELVQASGGGAVVNHSDAAGCVEVIRTWMADPAARDAAAARGHAFVEQRHNWARDGERFVEQLVAWSRDTSRGRRRLNGRGRRGTSSGSPSG